jgi:hypothetical protein
MFIPESRFNRCNIKVQIVLVIGHKLVSMLIYLCRYIDIDSPFEGTYIVGFVIDLPREIFG